MSRKHFQKKSYFRLFFFSFTLLPFLFPSLIMANVTITAGNGSGYLGSQNNPVQVSLDNPDDKVRNVAIDICDVDDYINTNAVTGCETTLRTADFTCMVYEISGCARVYLFPVQGGLIAKGTGSIVTLNFDVSASAPSGQSRALNVQNTVVQDEAQNTLTVTPVSGVFDFSSCSTDPQCDDGLYCSGTDTCSGGVCLHTGDPCPGTDCNRCNEADDTCFDPSGTACSDDNLYCNGSETCDGSGNCSVHSGDPCPGTSSCNEAGDNCTCSDTPDCDDGLYCTGLDYCLVGYCNSIGDPCTSSGLHCDEPGGQCVCWYDNECDDGLYCNGAETCSAGQCLPGTPPSCPPSYFCNEAGDNCTLADVTLTVDLNAAGLIGWNDNPVSIGLTNLYDKVGAVQFEICDENDYLAVTGCTTDLSLYNNPPPPNRVPSGMTCLYSPSINGCDSILVYDPVSSGLFISQGTGPILTMLYEVKGECWTRGAPCSCAETDCYELGTECFVGDPNCYLLVHNECSGGSCTTGCYQLKEPCMYADTGDISLDPQNLAVSDDSQIELSALGNSGQFKISCTPFQGEKCNNNVCTDDTCDNNTCVHVPNSAPCDDGLYCTTTDICSGGQCGGSGTPCGAGEICNEDNDTCVSCGTGDNDCDGVQDISDNCFVTGSPDTDTPNGPARGSCAATTSGVVYGTGIDCMDAAECLAGQTCQKNQEDYNANGVGDVCECYANIDINMSPSKVDIFDLLVMKGEYGRMDCNQVTPCDADIDGNGKVDIFDLLIMKSQYNWTNCPVI